MLLWLLRSKKCLNNPFFRKLLDRACTSMSVLLWSLFTHCFAAVLHLPRMYCCNGFDRSHHRPSITVTNPFEVYTSCLHLTYSLSFVCRDKTGPFLMSKIQDMLYLHSVLPVDITFMMKCLFDYINLRIFDVLKCPIIGTVFTFLRKHLQTFIFSVVFVEWLFPNRKDSDARHFPTDLWVSVRYTAFHRGWLDKS